MSHTPYNCIEAIHSFTSFFLKKVFFQLLHFQLADYQALCFWKACLKHNALKYGSSCRETSPSVCPKRIIN